MGALELLAIVVFFLIGYWVVSAIWPAKKTGAPAARVTVRVAQHFDAAPERVFDAWLDRATAGKWLFATPTGEMTVVEIDPRVGGTFTFIDRRDGEDVAHTGEYLELDRPRRLVFNFRVPKFSDEATRISIDIAPAASGCALTLVHEGVYPEYATRTQAGWNAILEGLAKVIAG
jgi:uncharacterized protein YndB with AHSA1/START domain